MIFSRAIEELNEFDVQLYKSRDKFKTEISSINFEILTLSQQSKIHNKRTTLLVHKILRRYWSTKYIYIPLKSLIFNSMKSLPVQNKNNTLKLSTLLHKIIKSHAFKQIKLFSENHLFQTNFNSKISMLELLKVKIILRNSFLHWQKTMVHKHMTIMIWTNKEWK